LYQELQGADQFYIIDRSLQKVSEELIDASKNIGKKQAATTSSVKKTDMSPGEILKLIDTMRQ